MLEFYIPDKIILKKKVVREAGFEPADSYESGFLIQMTPYFHTILSPPPLTGLGNSRKLMVGRAGFEPATLETKKHRASLGSRCKRDIIAELDYRPIIAIEV